MSTTNSRPLQNVTVTLSNGGVGDGGGPVTATTDANGTFSLPNQPIGAYSISFARTGFTSKTLPIGTSVAGPTILAVTMAPDTTPGVDAPTFQLTVSSSNGLTDPFAVGYGTAVTVAITNLADPAEPSFDAASYSYKWTIATAPTSANPKGTYTFSAAPTSTSTSAAFNAMTIPQVKGVEVCKDCGYANPTTGAPLGYLGRLGVLGINPDETGRYTTTVTVSDPEGHNYTFSQGIRSTWQAPGVEDVPVGSPVYLEGDTFALPNWKQSSPTLWKWLNDGWVWSFTSCTSAGSSPAPITCPTLADANTQYPHFLPAVAGTYVLQVIQTSTSAINADAGVTGPGQDAGPGPGGSYGTQTATLTVYAGSWLGVMNNNPAAPCGSCHQAGGSAPDKFTPWTNTAHQSAMQRKVDGLATSHFGEACLECHTAGWNEVATAQTAANNGFFYQLNHETGPDGGLWQYPNPMTLTSYSDMATNYPQLGYLGGIQCENCHGPAGGAATAHPGPGSGTGNAGLRFARVNWSENVCSSCHEEANTHYFPGQWALTKHSNKEVAIRLASVEAKATTPGGGADVQSGAQFCARCHSGQGFAEYVKLLNNGGTDRYDFITTDDRKLAADGGNAPTTAYLAGLGLTVARVESQTCQACHDPHSNAAASKAYGSDSGVGPVDCSQQGNYADPACKQLRVYDTLPGLPNGMGAFSGVGEGAICMACHNGRNGEHTDTRNQSPYVENPHDSTATEALFGYNAFFVPRYSPSPHMAIKDTCVGCHVNLPTAAQADAGFASNHGFATDQSICKNCHGSSGVDGTAIQAQVASEISTLGSAIVTAVTGAVTTTAASNPLCVQVSSISDPRCTGGSCKSSQVVPAVPFPVPPSNVQIAAGNVASATMSNGGSTSVTITLTAAGPSFNYYDPLDVAMANPIGTWPYSGNTKPKNYTVSIYTIQVGTCGAASPVYLFPVGASPPSGPDPTIPGKAIWNYTTLNNEGSGGIHNFPWTNAVIQATLQQLGTWKP